MHILIFLMMFFPNEPVFTGEITYEYSGFDNYVDQVEIVLGEDFFYKKMSGPFFEKQTRLPNEFLVDMNKRVLYSIFDDHYNSNPLEITEITTFFDFEVIDTLEFNGHSCKVLTFMLENKYTGKLTKYKYLYPLELTLPKPYKELPKFLTHDDDLFKPFNENFLPLYIELQESDSKNVKTITATQIRKKKIKRDDYFDLLVEK